MDSLNYAALKTAYQVREADEQRAESRKKNLLILVLHHLVQEGYSEAAKSLEAESNLCFNKFEVCDNVDLETILMEYESYYFVKFQKYPKITKKLSQEGTPSRHSKTKRQNSTPTLPRIPRSSDQGNTSSSANGTRRRPSSSALTSKRASSGEKRATGARDNSKQQNVPLMNGHGDPLSELSVSGSVVNVSKSVDQSQSNGLANGRMVHKKGPIIDMRAMLNNAVKGATQEYLADTDPSERLLKPLGGYSGYSLEWRELAQSISKDIYLHNPDVRWDDIMGLEAPKRLVKEAVVYPIKYPQLFTGILSPWKGLLLYGPPGTGKTLLAKAVATECNTTFFNISASSIVSKWRGDSEKLVRVLFELARFHAPSTIFLDELESVMSQRGSSSGRQGKDSTRREEARESLEEVQDSREEDMEIVNVKEYDDHEGRRGGGSKEEDLHLQNEHEGSRRMKTELLVQMDGLAKSDDLVFLLAASNLPWELDHAMLRRLEKRILVDLPTREARNAMLRFHLPPVINQGGALEIETELEYDYLAGVTEGYSGSDIRLVCKEAAMRRVRKVFNILESNDSDDNNMFWHEETILDLTIDAITTEDVTGALAHTKPSAGGLKEKYLQWQKDYESV